MAIGNGGSAMGFSQEVVQEFQISTVNFDLYGLDRRGLSECRHTLGQ